MHAEGTGRIHWSFWFIGALGLVFNLAGGVNFVSQMNPSIVDAMPVAYRTIVESRPAWATAAFAIAVFGGALGCLLLLLRKSVAYYVFIVSLLGAVAAQMPFFGMTDFPNAALIGGLIQLVVTAFLIWYAKWAQGKGWIN